MAMSWLLLALYVFDDELQKAFLLHLHLYKESKMKEENLK